MACDDGTLPHDSYLAQWDRHFVAASEKLGASTKSATWHKQSLIDAGFQDVVQVEYKWPTNPWPLDAKHKEIGKEPWLGTGESANPESGTWTLVNIEAGIQALSLMLFTNVLGWTASEVETFLVGVRKDLRNKSIHAYWPM